MSHLCVRCDNVLGLLRSLAAAHRGTGHQSSADNLDNVADDLASSFTQVSGRNPAWGQLS